MRTGTIVGLRGSWGSGIAILEIKDSETQEVEGIPCDNGATVRALQAAFGDTITPGHTANGQGYIGQDIRWVYDDLGLCLGGFAPV